MHGDENGDASMGRFLNGEYDIAYVYSDVNALTLYNSKIDEYSTQESDGEFEYKEFVNEDGDTVYYTQWLEKDVVQSYGLYKPIDDNHALIIIASRLVDGDYVWIETEEFFDLTKDCYYVIE